ncbi:hypothetical protein CC80DRAFT_490601 [Byssothecium circinans]|uniref:Uncharacterized protein n=1 Tax=Byssothecium circinans TaxID=147558 RepID=A0A6A5U3A8_9PLEO|nr:hypothetical protein CC80DRAFT_490601 [Byssothecium circinans]
MSPSPDSATDPAHPVSTLTHLHHQQRARHKPLDNTQSRGRNTSRNELGRRDRNGEKVTRIYPREITKSPPTAKRYSSASPNATTSPLLSAIGATKTAAQYTNEWTKSLPFFANQASPGNGGIAINGSPEGLYAPAAMSNSPPPGPGMRPLSHPNHYTSFGGRLQGSPHDSSGRDRRASLYSQPGVRPASRHFASNPPLPHQPQAHFYNLPALDDFGLNNTSGGNMTQTAGEGGYHCGFDTLSMAGDEAAKSAENVLLVGCQGGIDIFRVEKGKMDIVGRLEGLRGAVIGAKILPWTARHDPLLHLRPLIALTIHGPVVTESRSSNSGSATPSVVDDSSSDSPSRPGSSGGSGFARVFNYQTTVEVYSLKAKQRVAVLYQSPLVPLTSPFDSPIFQPPPPVGEFVVDAKGKFVVVASGASGEVFIFAPYLEQYEDYPEKFRCIGKVWTTVQFRERMVHSTTSSAADGSHEDVPPEKYGVPVLSLSDRWLAVTPPASTALRSINGIALVSPYYERPPGLAHHTVPPQPLPNTAVDAPEADSLVNRLTREGTQVAIKGARWATEKGIQAFKSYMNKNPQGNLATSNTPYGAEPSQHYFPPTHGHNQTQPRQESSVVSVYDLQRLQDAEETKNKNALHAIATIPAAQGCSFLSFSPSGLMLMTVSKKGDLQDVWDLKRMNFRRARKTVREQPSGPHVRQIARFARMTVTHVVDVVWSTPRIEKLAVVTDKGTVHMFLMPASAFQWPPPRRVRKPAEAVKPKEDEPAAGRGNAVTSAMQAINGTAMPFLNAIRPRNASNGSRFTLSSFGMTPAAGAKSGGKAVAAGVGKSINNIRHAGDNKLALPASLSGVKPHSVRWLTGRGRGSISLVSGGVLQIYKVQMRLATGKGKSANATSISKMKLVEFGLAPIYDARLAPSVDAQLSPQSEVQDDLNGVHGEWIPRLLPSRQGQQAQSLAPLSFSEIETNPPYQPFYTDRRVTRFVFSRVASDLQTSNSEQETLTLELVTDLHHENDDSPWLFGQDIEAFKIASPTAQDHGSGDEEFAAQFENKLVLRDGEEEAGKVVSTTRRRRIPTGVEEGEEGFFEDDCEVLDFAEDRV